VHLKFVRRSAFSRESVMLCQHSCENSSSYQIRALVSQHSGYWVSAFCVALASCTTTRDASLETPSKVQELHSSCHAAASLMHLNSLNCPVARARSSTAASLHHRSRPCVVAKHSKRDNAASSAKPAAADRAEVGGNHLRDMKELLLLTMYAAHACTTKLSVNFC
jgi:hypothetical protein